MSKLLSKFSSILLLKEKTEIFMIFRMEQQRVLLPLLVCQNGNCPPESSGAAVNELNDSSERNGEAVAERQAKSWTDGRECGSLAHFGIVQDCRRTGGSWYSVTTQ